MFLKLPSHSNLVFALSTPAKLSVCIKHAHWVMQALLDQSLRVSEENHDSDAKEHLHITCPLSKAAQHIQVLPALVLHKRSGKCSEERRLLEPLSFRGDRCFKPLLLWLPNEGLHRGEAPSHLLSGPAVEQRLEQQIPARLRLCSVQCRLHHRRGPEKRAPLPPKSIINHRFPFRGKLLICSFVFPFLSGAHFSGKLQLPLCSILWPIRRVACAYLMYCERCHGWGISHCSSSGECNQQIKAWAPGCTHWPGLIRITYCLSWGKDNQSV